MVFETRSRLPLAIRRNNQSGRFGSSPIRHQSSSTKPPSAKTIENQPGCESHSKEQSRLDIADSGLVSKVRETYVLATAGIGQDGLSSNAHHDARESRNSIASRRRLSYLQRDPSAHHTVSVKELLTPLPLRSRGDQHASRIEQSSSSDTRVSRSAPFTESIKSSHSRPLTKKRTSEHLREIIDRLMPSAATDAVQAHGAASITPHDRLGDGVVYWQSPGNAVENSPSDCTNDCEASNSLNFVSPSDEGKGSDCFFPSSDRSSLRRQRDEPALSSVTKGIKFTNNDIRDRVPVAKTMHSMWRQSTSASTPHNSNRANLEHDEPAVVCATIPVLAPAPLKLQNSWTPNLIDPLNFGMSNSNTLTNTVARSLDPSHAGREISYNSRSCQSEDEL